MSLLLAANNQATRRKRKNKKLNSKWVQAATDMHPACPNKKQNHLQNSLLRRTQFLGPENLLKTGFAQKGLPSG